MDSDLLVASLSRGNQPSPDSAATRPRSSQILINLVFFGVEPRVVLVSADATRLEKSSHTEDMKVFLYEILSVKFPSLSNRRSPPSYPSIYRQRYSCMAPTPTCAMLDEFTILNYSLIGAASPQCARVQFPIKPIPTYAPADATSGMG